MQELIINLGNWAIDTAQWWTTGVFGIIIYWIPVCVLLIHYTIKNWTEIKEDKLHVQKFNIKMAEWQNTSASDNEPIGRTPTYNRIHCTIGTISGRYLAAFMPILNFGLMYLDALGDLFTIIGERLKKIFNVNIIQSPKV